MNKGFLPIGSVVLLKGGTKRVMITGFCSIDNKDNTKVYDYTGCLYPEGIINSNEMRLFDKDEIDKVYFRGFEDQEQIDFQKILENVMSEYNSGIEETNNESDEPVVMYETDNEENIDIIEESI